MVGPQPFRFEKAPFLEQVLPAGFYEGEGARRGLAHLRYSIKQAEGIMILSGQKGVGKTALLEKVASEAESLGRRMIRLSGREVRAQGLAAAVLSALPEVTEDKRVTMTFADNLRELYDQGARLSVLVDDADVLSSQDLEAIREASLLFHEGEALLQFAIVGGDAVRQILYRDDTSAFRDRVVASYHLPPLKPEDIDGYVNARLSAVGAKGDEVFDASAIEALGTKSSGLPAKINALAHGAISAAWDGEERRVTAEDVATVDIDAMTEEEETQTVAAVKDDEPQDEARRINSAPATAPSTSSVTASAEATQPVAPARGYPISVTELNAAIERLQQPAAPVASPPPSPPAKKRRPLSPQALMERSARKRAPEPPVRPAEIDAAVWDDATEMDEQEADRLDAETFTVPSLGEDPLRAGLASYLTETKATIERLRASIEKIRSETDTLAARRQSQREMIRDRLDGIQSQLDLLKSERNGDA